MDEILLEVGFDNQTWCKLVQDGSYQRQRLGENKS